MNKETKKFKAVIKKRHKRVVRIKHAKEMEVAKFKPKFKWASVPEKKENLGNKLLKALHIK